ncbi:MAG TPA: NAD(P)-dependent oxidoreductase, partial [Cystobacter sp.]
MTTKVTAPALILGATGVVGAKGVRLLRTLHPVLPIAIGARDQDKCRALAEEVGNAVAVKPDLSRADLGLGGEKYSAVVALLKENTLNPLRFAQTHGLPYINMADGAFEIGPAVARFVYNPGGAPILLAGHWVVGMTTLPALFF